jgi:UDP-2,3-diacylglucosamine pyrophosphatase LpxH
LILNSYFAVAVSDLHLGYKPANKLAFEHFVSTVLAKNSIKNFILIGDILELWRRVNEEVIEENIALLKRIMNLQNIQNIYYVRGNHDYIARKLLKDRLNRFKFKKKLILETRQIEKFLFIHGHEMCMERKWLTDAYDKFCLWNCNAGQLGRIESILWEYTGGRFGKLNRFFKQARRDWRRKSASEQRANAAAIFLYECSPGLRRRILSFLKKHPRDRRFNTIRDLFPEARKVFSRLPPHIRDKLEVTGFMHAKDQWRQLSVGAGIADEQSIIADAQQYAGLKDESLVYGHTHEFMNGKRVFNTGGWYNCQDYWYFVIKDSGEIGLEQLTTEPGRDTRLFSGWDKAKERLLGKRSGTKC